MNKTVTSKEDILSVCKQMMHQSKLQTLTIREVAIECHVSIGSIYNYFPSKNELIVATIASIWTEIIDSCKLIQNQKEFSQNVSDLFQSILQGSQKYPLFFNEHSLYLEKMNKDKGKLEMNNYFKYMKRSLLKSLEADPKIQHTTFTSSFTKEQFIDFVFSTMIALLMKKENCHVLLEIIQRTIY